MALVDILAIGLAILGTGLLVLVGLLFIEIFSARADAGGSAPHPVARPRMAVLMPAHNEALLIGATIASVRAELGNGDRLLVVADNCSDETAALARAAGAEVVERTDAERRGKGFALDFGVRHLAGDPPDVVIVNDADCRPEPGAFARIAAMASQLHRPVQAYYGMLQPAGSRSLYLSMATFAMRVKNLARPLGRQRLGIACQLMGTGMAFPWPLISKAELATSEIVEDLVYGLEFARAGHPPAFCPAAAVISEFPTTEEGQKTQRTRWEAGHLNAIARHVPGLLLEAIRRRDRGLLLFALDAAIPPLAFLVLLAGAYTLLAGVLALLGGSIVPLALAIAIGLLFSAAILRAWWAFGRDIVSIYELALSPGYILSKLGLYGLVLVRQKVEWIRSKRDAG